MASYFTSRGTREQGLRAKLARLSPQLCSMALVIALAVAVAPFPASAQPQPPSQTQALNLATMQDAINRQAVIVKGDQKALNALTDKFTADAAGDLAPVVAGGSASELVGTTMDGVKTS